MRRRSQREEDARNERLNEEEAAYYGCPPDVGLDVKVNVNVNIGENVGKTVRRDDEGKKPWREISREREAKAVLKGEWTGKGSFSREKNEDLQD